MYISKFFIYYIIIYLIYKLYKNKYFKEFNMESPDNITVLQSINIQENTDNIEILSLVPYIKKSKYNLSEIYDNFFNGKKKKLTSDFDINDYKIDLFKMQNNNKEIIILNERTKEIILDKNNNFLKFNFDSKKNKSYKIKYKLFSDEYIKNIKLIIAGNNKRFVYDFCENNLIDGNIKEYGFILDNNIFSDDTIHIYIILSDINIINIQDSFIEIIEKPLNSDNSIIVFDVNSKYYPIYFDEINLFEFSEFNDNNNVFFI